MLNPPGLCDLRQAGATSLNEAATGTQIHAKGEKRGVQRPRRAFQQSNQTPQRACQRGLPRMAGSRGLAQPGPRFARRCRGAPCCVGTATQKCPTRPFARRCLIARPATSICSRSSRSGPLDRGARAEVRAALRAGTPRVIRLLALRALRSDRPKGNPRLRFSGVPYRSDDRIAPNKDVVAGDYPSPRGVHPLGGRGQSATQEQPASSSPRSPLTDRSRLWNFTRAASPPVVKSV